MIDLDQRRRDLRRMLKEQRRFFKARSLQRREWEGKRDGSQGAAGPCRWW
jgi:hypothetical protein